MTTDKQDSRAAFEADYLAQTKDTLPDLFEKNDWAIYKHFYMQCRWEGWQASRKQALAECVAEMRGMKANNKTAQSTINQCAEALENLK